MKKNSKPFTYIFAIVFLLNSNLFASTFYTVKVDIPLWLIWLSLMLLNADIAVAPPLSILRFIIAKVVLRFL
jgi:hypothetical protein